MPAHRPARTPRHDAATLARVLALGEGRQVEFKEGLAADGRAARTLCAFANTRGGMLFVGVDDRGRPFGVARPDGVARALREMAATMVVPSVHVRVGTTRIDGKALVWCSVPLSPARPHACVAGGASEVLVRAGSSNRRATPAVAASLRPVPETRAPLGDEILAAARRTGGITVATFAAARGVGKQRARQALERLERAGRLVAHGLGDDRVFEPA
jgi:hypothetical protein